MKRKGRLLWVDGLGGLLAGTVVLLLSGWLSEVERLPEHFVVFMAGANLVYGAYATSLASRPERPAVLVGVLACANMFWLILCLGFALWFRDQISVFGLLHVLGEGAYVGGLGCLEWRWRVALRAA
jgi:hypothetical protein